jgi:hypothetical protein
MNQPTEELNDDSNLIMESGSLALNVTAEEFADFVTEIAREEAARRTTSIKPTVSFITTSN